MIKKVIEISQRAVHLSVRDGQLVLREKTGEGKGEQECNRGATGRRSDGVSEGAGDQPKSPGRRGVRARMGCGGAGDALETCPAIDGLETRPTDEIRLRKEESRIPCEDIGVVMVEEAGTTYTHGALLALADAGAVVVVCGRNHLPVGMMLPVGEHSQVVWRIGAQISAGKVLKKRLWQQLVRAKIRGQAENLGVGSAVRRRLTWMARNVRSGDPENVEAQAAKLYWGAWWGECGMKNDESSVHGGVDGVHRPPDGFRRDAEGRPPNNMLNYGYAVVRAGVARAIVAAGLAPAIGIKHSNRSNAFCLADDLVEPLRPIVDDVVAGLVRDGQSEMDRYVKASLLEVMTVEVECGGVRGPLMVALHRMVVSLVGCMEGERAELAIPRLIEDGA